MSIDLNWETLTSGPDGDALAIRIRDFIHTKFQAVQLPRFIKSVKVHDFQFGSIPPKVTLKDICDPLPDFYEEMPEADELDDEDGSDEDGDEAAGGAATPADEVPDAIRAAERRRREEQRRRLAGGGNSRSASPAPDHLAGFPPHIHTAGLRSAPQTPDLGSPFLGLGVSTPGIPGGTASMAHYFPSHIATGWPSGAQTPLAAVAGAQHLNGWLESGASSPFSQSPSSQNRAGGNRHGNGGHHRNHSQSSISIQDFPTGNAFSLQSQLLREKHSVSTLAPTSAGASRPPTRDTSALTGSMIDEGAHDVDGSDDLDDDDEDDDEVRKFREPRIEDMQAVFRIKYAGDIKLMLTAEILLDYPMPSFVGIPVKLNITGLSFDGVGVVANIRKRVHFCFLSPEDAVTAVGNDADSEDEEPAGSEGGEKRQRTRMGGLLQEIKVESEIGQREGIKQSLKNVGKVERFVLEQVRRIFEEEFVYPSFWTFLV